MNSEIQVQEGLNYNDAIRFQLKHHASLRFFLSTVKTTLEVQHQISDLDQLMVTQMLGGRHGAKKEVYV